MSKGLDPDESKTIPDQLYRIAEESEGGASRVMDQVEISINNFEDIKSKAAELMKRAATVDGEFTMTQDEVFELCEELISYADNGLLNLEGIMDLYQYQDVVRQKLEKVGHQLIDVSEYIRQKLVPDVSSLTHIPPSGKDILDRRSGDADSQVEDVEDIIAQFLKNRA
jgi:chemotaxis regulatin CheY-phosphate phosphatase CheZ